MSSAPLAGLLITALFSAAPVIAGVGKPATRATLALQKRVCALVSWFLLLLLVGLAIGIKVRTANWLNGSPYAVELSDIEAAGFTPFEAKTILLKRLVAETTLPKRPEIMFSMPGNEQDCNDLKPSSVSALYSDILSLYGNRGEPWPTWVKVTETTLKEMKPTDEAIKNQIGSAILSALWHVSCSPQNGVQ
jgi:hypothetical protein